MLVYANSYGSHFINHKDLKNPNNNKQMKKTFKMRLNKNGHDFADVAVNENGKYYYRKFDNLQNFFQNLNANDNSIFQLAKNNNKRISKRNYYSSISNNDPSIPYSKSSIPYSRSSIPYSRSSSRSRKTRTVPHIKLIKKPSAINTPIQTYKSLSYKPSYIPRYNRIRIPYRKRNNVRRRTNRRQRNNARRRTNNGRQRNNARRRTNRRQRNNARRRTNRRQRFFKRRN